MSRNDVIRMAREAGYYLYDLTETHGIKTVETDEADEWAQLARFAALVAAAEREACALVCDSRTSILEHHLPKGVAADYFTRGAESASRRNAAAIRARSAA